MKKMILLSDAYCWDKMSMAMMRLWEDIIFEIYITNIASLILFHNSYTKTGG